MKVWFYSLSWSEVQPTSANILIIAIFQLFLFFTNDTDAPTVISWVILSCLPQILIQNTKDFYLIQIFKFSQLYWICSSYIVLMQSEIWHSVHDHSRIRHTSLKENSCIFIPYFVQWRVKSVFRPLIGLQRMEMQRSVERWNIRHNSSCKCFIQHFLNVV